VCTPAASGAQVETAKIREESTLKIRLMILTLESSFHSSVSIKVIETPSRKAKRGKNRKTEKISMRAGKTQEALKGKTG
jgi:hypothetical protein